MNKIIPTTINFTELVQNSKTTLSLNLQTKLITHLNTEFTEEEQQWYIANLYIYMQYHPTEDYPINLEHVFPLIGFANKGNAMKTIKNNFTENEDYKKLLFRTEKQVKNGKDLGGAGLNQENIMLNIDTFKNLCMLAKTKKGKDIRKYYVKLENIYNKLIKEEIEESERQKEESMKELEESKKELEKTKKKLELRTKQRWLDIPPGQAIYAVKTNVNDPCSLISIGKTKNITHRESNYFTHNQNSDMFYFKKCSNCDLAERIIHHILALKRVNAREWFQISEKESIYIIDLVINFMDNFITCIEKLPDTSLLADIQKISNSLLIKTDDETNTIKKSKSFKTLECKFIDYTSFINECCEINENYFCIPEELLGAYKIWCRSNVDTNKKNLLYKYIKSKFKCEKKFLEKHKASINCFSGIKPKEIKVQFENTHLEQFIEQQCDIGYTYKIIEKKFIYAYSEWIGKELTSDDLIVLKAELNKNFYFGNINYSKEKKKYGYHGFKLKTDIETIHCLRNKKHTKAVVKFNIHTKQIEKEYMSINATAFALNKRYETIINYIKKQSILDECYVLQYKWENEK